MSQTQQSVQRGWLRPLRKAGLALARHWPWPVAAQLKTGRNMYVDLRSSIGRAIYMKGEFDPKVFEPLAGCLSSGGVFLDVGANVGYYSMRALACVGESGAVHAFEIDPRPLRCLRKTIAREEIKNISVHEFAVSDSEGETRLTMGEDAGHSSVATSGIGRTVRLTTLDAWSRRHPALKVQAIKLDIEGSELAALRGAMEILRRDRPLLVCELQTELQGRKLSEPGEVLALLESAGYRWQWLEGTNDPTIVATRQD